MVAARCNLLLRHVVRGLLHESSMSDEVFAGLLTQLIRSRKGSKNRREAVEQIVAFGLEPLEDIASSSIDVKKFWELLQKLMNFVGLDPDMLRDATDAWSDWNEKRSGKPYERQNPAADKLEIDADRLKSAAIGRLVHDLDARAFGRMLVSQHDSSIDWRPSTAIPEDYYAL